MDYNLITNRLHYLNIIRTLKLHSCSQPQITWFAMNGDTLIKLFRLVHEGMDSDASIKQFGLVLKTTSEMYVASLTLLILDFQISTF